MPLLFEKTGVVNYDGQWGRQQEGSILNLERRLELDRKAEFASNCLTSKQVEFCSSLLLEVACLSQVLL